MSVRRKLRFRWLWASYLMIAGGFVLAAVILLLLEQEVVWLSMSTFLLGSAIGAFFSCRASPGKIIVEATIAGVLFGVTILGVLHMRGWPLGGRSLGFALTAAGMSTLGALIGAVAGERTNPSREYSFWRWLGIGSLVHAGVLVVATAIAAWLDDTVLFVYMAATVVGGATIQILAPQRALAPCWLASTSIVVMVTPLYLREVNGSGQALMLIVGVVIATAVWGMLGLIGGALGLAIGHKWIPPETHTSPEPLPSAKLR